MEPAQLADLFIDFVLTSGTGKLGIVKQLKQGRDERFSDFYRPVRETVADMHRRGGDVSALDALLVSLVDPRERRVFPKVVRGYQRFLEKHRVQWFEPPFRSRPLDPITVDVNPELGLLINGRPHAIKLYFRGDPPSPQRVMVTNELMYGAFSATWPGTVCATLDVRRAKLFPYRPKPEIGALLRAEAACFSNLWNALS